MLYYSIVCIVCVCVYVYMIILHIYIYIYIYIQATPGASRRPAGRAPSGCP